MNRFFIMILSLLLSVTAFSQQRDRKFDPEQFSRDQENYIIKEAKLTQQEAAAFLPIFREMQQRQRVLFKQQRQYMRSKPANDKDAAKIISGYDNTEMQLKKLQMQYHSRFLKVLPASKVFLCMQAEEIFKHQLMKRMTERGGKRGNPPAPKK